MAPRFRREQKTQQREVVGFAGAAFANEGKIAKRKTGVPSALWCRGSSPSGARSRAGFRPIERFSGPIVEPRSVPCAWTRPNSEAPGHASRAGAPIRRAPDLGNSGFCIRRSGGVIQGSPRGFPPVAAHVRRPMLLLAARRTAECFTENDRFKTFWTFPPSKFDPFSI